MRLEVGRIGKAHGLRGEVVVTLLTDRTERLAVGVELFCDDRTLTVETSRPHQNRYLVKFAEISGRDEAQAAGGMLLFADPLDDSDVLWVHDLVGKPVVDTTGDELGVVVSVEANPASDLLVLGDGGLVPLTFFVEVSDDGTIVVDPPEGLLEPHGADSD